MAWMKWLLASDPSIRWQVMRDLAGEREEAVVAERSRVAVEGWGARLLGLQEPDGNWGGGPWVFQSWASTMETLMLLRELGLDPAGPQARKAIGLVRDKSNWGPHHGHSPFFEGEEEPCINGRAGGGGRFLGPQSEVVLVFAQRQTECRAAQAWLIRLRSSRGRAERCRRPLLSIPDLPCP